ncbi:MCE family protein [Hyunsoonleella sp. SJ7]|uniref:MCE family protein n=1 Tax=Hyunsoonleella aquatilis TaxID=2762758 RepID=A0A923H926_9FLAO|nr:MlaD family protein [Hyunsoonleella aquatilis]MBC3758628.1 MCE family protein [Hyunsoonleella aquatilis]
MKISREVKVGVLVLVGIALFIYGFNYLKGEDILSSSDTFFTEYENVEGLVPSTPVTINGLSVGKVTHIDFKEDGSGKLKVTMVVDSDFEFSKNSRAELYETGLIGGKAIAIIPAFDGAEKASSGDVLQGGVKAGLTELVNQRLTPLQEKIEIMMVGADSLLGNVNEVFDAKTKANLRDAIAQLDETMKNFNGASSTLNKLLANNEAKLNSTFSNLETITDDFSQTADQLSQINLKETFDKLEGTIQNLNALTAKIDKGEGSVGKLMNDDELYINLKGASKELEELLRDVKLHPKRYFRILSKKEIPYEEETN